MLLLLNNHTDAFDSRPPSSVVKGFSTLPTRTLREAFYTIALLTVLFGGIAPLSSGVGHAFARRPSRVRLFAGIGRPRFAVTVSSSVPGVVPCNVVVVARRSFSPL